MNFITINIQSLSSVQEEEADVGERLAYLVGWMGMRKCGDESNSGTWNENGVASGRFSNTSGKIREWKTLRGVLKINST